MYWTVLNLFRCYILQALQQSFTALFAILYAGTWFFLYIYKNIPEHK